MLRNQILTACLIAISATGCNLGPVLQTGPSLEKDVMRYDGLHFVSGDDLETFEQVTVVPRLCTMKVIIQPKVGPAIPESDLTLKYFQENRRTMETYSDDGQGTFLLRVEHGLVVSFENHRPATVSIDCPNLLEEEKHFALLFKGKVIQIPIRRTALEELLGPPDEIARNSAPPLR